MRIKVISLNLWLGGFLFEQILEFLNMEKSDVLLVQEAYGGENNALDRRFHSIDVLKRECGFKNSFFSPMCVAVLKEGAIESGNAIFSNFPIVKSETIFFDVPFGEVHNFETPGGDYSQTPRNLQHAVIQVGGSNLNVFNTQGIWGKDSEDNERRLKMSRVIVEKIRGTDNVIFGGDLNAMPHTKTISNIEELLSNPFKEKVKTTFNLKQKANPIFANFVVDMLFVGKDVRVVDSYCPEVDISDHLPLVCVLEI